MSLVVLLRNSFPCFAFEICQWEKNMSWFDRFAKAE